MKIIAVRHGETEENRAQIIQGHLHGTLTPNGVEQARQMAAQLKDEKIDMLISSDLERCVRTMDEVRKYHPETPFYYTDKLREYHFGVLQGKHKILRAIDPKNSVNIDIKVEGGESTREVRARIVDCLNDAYTKHPNGTVLVCTHDGPIRLIRWLLEGIGMDRDSGQIANGGIWRFEMDDLLLRDT